MRDDDSTEAMLAERAERIKANIVRDLRRCADKIEGRTVRPNLRDLKPDFMALVRDVEHELKSLAGNSELGALMAACYDAHTIIRYGIGDLTDG